MRATASAILDGLLVIGLPLVVGLFGWLTNGYVAWGAGLLTALAGLFVVRLRAQWRASAAIAGDWAPDPAPGLRLARWGTSRLLKVLRTFAGRRYLSFEHVVFVLLAAAVFYQVLGPPVVGLADNGDFGWIISQAGLEEIEATSDEDHNFINLDF